MENLFIAEEELPLLLTFAEEIVSDSSVSGYKTYMGASKPGKDDYENDD